MAIFQFCFVFVGGNGVGLGKWVVKRSA